MANEKRITVDIVVPLSGRGGVENVINRTARYLMEQGFLVRVVQMVYDGPAWLDAEVAFYPLRREKVNDILDFIPMYAQFMEQTYAPGLVLATPWPYMALAARKALEQCQDAYAKVVAWLHGPLEVYKKYEVGGAECLSFADQVFVLNRRTLTTLEQVLPQVPAKLVCNPVDFSGCREVTPENNRCLLFVGRLSPEKKVSVILDAIAASDGWCLRVIGNGEEYGALTAQAERLGIAGRVTFLGWQDHPWEHVQGVDALVLASEYEAFPLVAIEALACGLPIFSTPVDGIIELVRPGENGFLFAQGAGGELAQILDFYAAGKLPRIKPAVCKQSVQAYEAGIALQSFAGLLKSALDMISVIIPCYNASDCISNCLNSIFGQKTEVQIEVICVDDRSTDNTVEVLTAWEARYPESLTVILLEENGKQGRARNFALSYAAGNYVTYVDADDEVLPGYFDRLYETMLKNDCEAAGCGYRLAFPDHTDDVPVWAEPALFDFENSVADMQKYLMCLAWKTSPWGRLYRTDFLRENGILFAEGLFMEDILFSDRCLKYMKRYAHIPDTLYLYRFNPNGTMASEKAKDYFLDTAVVQNMAIDELMGDARFEDCESELAYTYFSKAFAEPMQRMWENAAFFSYDAYCYLKENVQKHFPAIGENRYLRTTDEAEMQLAFSFYQSDIPSADVLWRVMGYDQTE